MLEEPIKCTLIDKLVQSSPGAIRGVTKGSRGRILGRKPSFSWVDSEGTAGGGLHTRNHLVHQPYRPPYFV